MVDFEALFRHSPNPYMVVDRDLRYLAVNQAYAALLSTTTDALVGRRVFDAFPGDTDTDGHSESDAVRRSILRVFETGRPDMLALVPYTIEREAPDGRHVEERYWSATHTPVFDASGQVHAVLQHTTDVTDVQRTRAELEAVRQAQGATPEQLWQGVVSRARAVQDANSALEAQRRHLMSLFAQAPGFMAVISGPITSSRSRTPRTRNSSAAAISSDASWAKRCPRSSNRTTCNCSTRCARPGGASSGAAWKSNWPRAVASCIRASSISCSSRSSATTDSPPRSSCRATTSPTARSRSTPCAKANNASAPSPR